MKSDKADRAWRRGLGELVLAACLLFAGVHSPGEAGEAAGPTKADTKKKSQAGGSNAAKQKPIFVSSDRMEVDRQKNILIYLGQVVVIQADMTMRSDKLTTYFDADLQQMKEAIAEGKRVQVTQGDRVATGTKAVFDGVAQTITMTGNPVMRQGNSEVSGERIIYFMTEDRAIVESGKANRVKATIFPDELQGQKDGSEPKKEK
ncbi:MAG: lipopolysaccharide transport periplasmic protein LptA [Candidatus Binatia bacterium]